MPLARTELATTAGAAIRRISILLPILATTFLAVVGPHLRAHADDSAAGFATGSILLQTARLPAGGSPDAAPDGGAAPPRSDAAASVVQARLADQGDRTRFVLEMTAAAEFDLYLLDGPPRAVVDFSGLDWAADDGSGGGGGLVSAHRHGLVRDDTMRVVLDLTGPAAIRDVFFLPATGPLPYRFVLDLEATDPARFAGLVVESEGAARPRPAAGTTARTTARTTAGAPLLRTEAMPARAGGPAPPADRPALPTVVLDAGHGGIDPGATGIDGLHEKHITLDMAMRVGALLEETGRYRVVLTRDRDVYLRLGERVAIARREAADLFVSLHADHYPEPWLRGASVYTVSDRASDREAAALARRENRADLIAGVAMAPPDDLTASILIDLAQRRTLADSARVADLMVDALGEVTALIPDAHRQAGFVVLKAPDVPSVLVELGYLSNTEDERLLGTAVYRARLARALVDAVDAYFRDAEALARN